MPVTLVALELHRRLRPLEHDHASLRSVCCHLDRATDERRVRQDGSAGVNAARGCHDHLDLGVVDPNRNLFAPKPSEDHRVNCPEPAQDVKLDESVEDVQCERAV